MSELVKTAESMRKAASEIEAFLAKVNSSNSTSTTTTLTPTTSQTGIVQETRRLFGPYTYPNYGRANRRNFGVQMHMKQSTWSHKFLCLSNPNQETIPDKVLKKRLNEAGLGERKVTFPKNADPKCLRDSLLKTFPKLEFAGGFDLMRSTSRVCLEVIHPPNCGYTTQFLSEESCIGQAIIYIRPLQKELDMTPRVTVSEPAENCPMEECIECGESVPVISLRKHIQECHELVDFEDDNDLPEMSFKGNRKAADQPICGFACVQSENSIQNIESKCASSQGPSTGNCPVCFGVFLTENLEKHAATCGDIKDESVESECSSTLTEGLEVIMEKHLSKYWDISVIRRNFLETAFEQIRDAEDSDWNRRLKIKFVGEEGIDSGGLTREFFSLVFRLSRIFEDGLLTFDSDMFKNQDYRLMGKLVSMAILHGHTGPRCLQDHLVQFILKGETPDCSSVPIEQVPKEDIRSAIKEIAAIGPDNENEVNVEYSDLLESTGFNKLLRESNKDEAVNAIKAYFLHFRCLPATLQFMDGLKLHGVLGLLQKYYADGSKFLLKGTEPTALEVKEFFQSSFSLSKEEKELEEVVVYNFHSFLQKVERGRVQTKWVDIDQEIEDDVVVSMSHVLQALVGSPALPPNIASGLIEFDHKSEDISSANTCAPSIRMSRITRLQNYKKFEEDFLELVVAYGFGNE